MAVLSGLWVHDFSVTGEGSTAAPPSENVGTVDARRYHRRWGRRGVDTVTEFRDGGHAAVSLEVVMAVLSEGRASINYL